MTNFYLYCLQHEDSIFNNTIVYPDITSNERVFNTIKLIKKMIYLMVHKNHPYSMTQSAVSQELLTYKINKCIIKNNYINNIENFENNINPILELFNRDIRNLKKPVEIDIYLIPKKRKEKISLINSLFYGNNNNNNNGNNNGNNNFSNFKLNKVTNTSNCKTKKKKIFNTIKNAFVKKTSNAIKRITLKAKDFSKNIKSRSKKRKRERQRKNKVTRRFRGAIS